MKHIIKRICLITALFVLIYFVIYFAFSIIIGGDAINGYIESQNYFVVNYGKSTEVTKIIWTISYYATVFLWIIFPCGMIGGFIYNIIGKDDKDNTAV